MVGGAYITIHLLTEPLDRGGCKYTQNSSFVIPIFLRTTRDRQTQESSLKLTLNFQDQKPSFRGKNMIIDY